MNGSSGLGQPGPGQPDFDGPQGSAPSPQQPPSAASGPYGETQRYGSPDHEPTQQFGTPQYEPTQQYPTSQQYPPTQQYGAPQQGQWAPPTQQPWGPPSLAPTPGGGGRSGGGRVLLIAGGLVVVLILGLLAWQVLPAVTTPQTTAPATSVPPATTAAPTPAPTGEPSVVRTPREPSPTTSADVTGGGIGQKISYRSGNGEATVTVTRASWADNGVLPPSDGMSYLVVDLSFEGVSGEVTTGPFFLMVRPAGGESTMMTIGAQLDNQLAMKTIGAGETNTGQVGFELPRGAVTLIILDETFQSVATVEIPG